MDALLVWNLVTAPLKSDIVDCIFIVNYQPDQYKSRLVAKGFTQTYDRHIVIPSQRKYTLGLLKETGILGYKPMVIFMDIDSDFWTEDGWVIWAYSTIQEARTHISYYNQTKISFAIRLVSLLMHKPKGAY